MGSAASTPEAPATNGHAEEAAHAAAEPLLGGHHPSKPFDLRATFSASLAVLCAVFLALFFVFVRQAFYITLWPQCDVAWSVVQQAMLCIDAAREALGYTGRLRRMSITLSMWPTLLMIVHTRL